MTDPNDRTAEADAAQAALDSFVLDGALWRTHRQLVGIWLHSFRGSLNAMSLALVVVENRSGMAASDGRPLQVLRAQLRELDAGLTRLLDRSALDDARPDYCDAVAVVEAARTLVEPLANRRRVTLDTSGGTKSVHVRIDAATLEALLVLLLADAIERSRGHSTVVLSIDAPGADSVRLECRGGTTPLSAPRDPLLAVAAERLIRGHGGEMHWEKAESPSVSIVLRRAASPE